jgi:hypothetical protein
MAADRDISAQEAAHLLLGHKLVDCSRSFVNLNAAIDAPDVLRDPVDLDDDDAAFAQPFFLQYHRRGPESETLNAVEYCMQFNTNRGVWSDFIAPRMLNTVQAPAVVANMSSSEHGPGSHPLLSKKTTGLKNGL